jgi:hypothetical protein
MEPRWRLGAWLGTPAPGALELQRRELAVRKVELDYGLSLPHEFRDYLLFASPVEQAWDQELVIWWPIERLRPIPDEYQDPVGDPEIAATAAYWLFFADFSDWSWAWAINCGEGEQRGKVALIGGEPDRIVADSFSDFVERHFTDPDSLS